MLKNHALLFPFCLFHLAPSSPPADFRGHNLSSTRIKVFWGDVPKHSIHGILIGFHVACEKLDFTDEHFVDTKSEHHKCEFRGMEKYTNYSCRLRAYNNFGNGTWSKQLVISTDEDGMWKIRSVCLLLEKKSNPYKETNGQKWLSQWSEKTADIWRRHHLVSPTNDV